MNKYLVFRCGKSIWKNIKKHELIGVELADDIDEAFEDIEQDVIVDLKGMQDYPYPVYSARADYIDVCAESSKYDYQVLGVAVPEGNAPHNYTCWYGVIETATEV